MPLVKRIRQLADERGMTIAELERKLNFGNSTIRKWSTQSPSIDRLQKVADYFNVSIDYLLGRENLKVSSRAITIARRYDKFDKSEQEAIDALTKSLVNKNSDKEE